MTSEGPCIRLLTLTILLSLSMRIEPSPFTLMDRTRTERLDFLEKKSVENDRKWVANERNLAELKNLIDRKLGELKNLTDKKLAEERSRTDTQLAELKVMQTDLEDFVSEVFNSTLACNDSVQFGTRCYKFVKDVYTTWYEARDACAKYGGHLASVTSKVLHDLILSELSNWDVWLGGNDIETNGTWVWHDGKSVGGGGAWTNWEFGFPDKRVASHDCMYLQDFGWWDTYSCDGQLLAYVCETTPVPRGM